MSDEASFGNYSPRHGDDDAARRSRQPYGERASGTGSDDRYRREPQSAYGRDDRDRDRAMSSAGSEPPRRGWHDDPHYAQHRDEQERLLDAEYREFCAWRRERFRDDFEAWRRERQARAFTEADRSAALRAQPQREPAGEPFREIGTESFANVRGETAPSVRDDPVHATRTEEEQQVYTEKFFERS